MMNIGQLLYQCDNDTKNLFRKIERTRKKIVETEWSIKFNNICINEQLWPTYTNLRPHDPALNNTVITRDYKRYILKNE